MTIRARRNFILPLAAALALLVDHASAGTTWNGNAAATTGNWDAAANWEGTLPTFNDTTDLLFRNTSLNNRQTSVVQTAKTVRSLTFNSNVTNGFEIRLTTTTESAAVNLTMGSATNAAAITVDSGAVGNITIGKGSGTVFGNLILGNNLTVAQNSTSGTLIIDAPITGAYGLTKNGTGSLVLSGANTYTGATTISGGELVLSGSGRLSVSSALDLSGSTARLNISGISAAGSTNASLAGAAGSVVNLGSKNLDVGGANTSTTFAGVLTNTGSLTKSGTGTLTLSGSNSYTGATTLSAGTLALGDANALAGGGIIAFTGGTLQYSVSNTNDYSARITNSTSAVKIDTAGQNVTWATALNSTAASGGLTKQGAGTLSVSYNGNTIYGGNTTVNGGTLRLVNVGATVPSMPGTSTTLNNGSTLILSNTGGEGRVSMSGGDAITFGASGGNSLVVNLTSSLLGQGTLNTFTTLGGTTNYITTSGSAFFNMQGIADRYAVFDVADGTGATDLQVDLSVRSGGIIKNGAGVLTLTKDNIGITNLVISNGTLGLAGAGRLDSGTFAVDISNNGTFAYNGTNNQTLSGAMSGTGSLTKSGNATLTLSGANTYSGGTVLGNGVLRLQSAAGAGTGTITQTDGTSTIEIDTTGTVANAMNFYNLSTLQTVTLSGNKTLNNATYTVASGTTTTESGFLSGSGGITKQGTGTLIVTASNSFTGAVDVQAGLLNLNSATGGAAASAASVAVATNATLLVSVSGQVSDTAAVTLSGGTISRGSGVSEVFGDLNITTGSFLNFGSGTGGELRFGAYEGGATPSALLSVSGFFQGNSLTFGSDISSYIASSSAGPYSGTYFSFDQGFTTTGWNGSTFTITAIPEPSTVLAALLLLGLIGAPAVRRLIRPGSSRALSQ